jgi:hypothetical protein
MSMIADAIGKIDVKSAFRILHEDKRWYGSPAQMKATFIPGVVTAVTACLKDTAALVKYIRKMDLNLQYCPQIYLPTKTLNLTWLTDQMVTLAQTSQSEYLDCHLNRVQMMYGFLLPGYNRTID